LRQRLLLVLALAGGLLEAFLRAWQLVRTIEPETGLVRPDNPVTVLLPVLVILLGALFFVFTVLVKYPERAQVKPVRVSWLVLEALGIAFMGAAGVAELREGWISKMFVRSAFGILTLLTALCVLLVALHTFQKKIKPSSTYGFWASIPIYWAAFALVMNFYWHAGQPVQTAYIYGTLALVAASLSILGVTGFYFRRGRHMSTLFYTLAAIVLSVLTAVGYTLTPLIPAPEDQPRTVSTSGDAIGTVSDKVPLHQDAVPFLSDMLIYGFIFCHMMAAGLAITGGVYDFGVLPEQPDAPPKGKQPPDETEVFTKVIDKNYSPEPPEGEAENPPIEEDPAGEDPSQEPETE